MDFGSDRFGRVVRRYGHPILGQNGSAVVELVNPMDRNPRLFVSGLDDGTVYGLDSGRPVCRTVSGDRTIESPFYKKSEIRDRYNEMSLEFRKFILRFRVYDEGMAYRFISKSGVPFKVVSEQAVFSFPEDSYSYVPYVKKPAGESFESQFYNSFENTYSHVRLSEWDSRRLAFMPVAVEAAL